jgi:hypothetical protein
MATVIKTIKKSGGDFTSLQDWWNWAKTQGGNDQWAEVYSGFDAGPVDITDAVFSGSNSVKIYGADENWHEGSSRTDSAYISKVSTTTYPIYDAPAIRIDIPNVTIKRMKIIADGPTDAIVLTTNASNAFVDGCLIICEGINLRSAIYSGEEDSSAFVSISNTIIYAKHSVEQPVYEELISTTDTSPALVHFIHGSGFSSTNNTIHSRNFTTKYVAFAALNEAFGTSANNIFTNIPSYRIESNITENISINNLSTNIISETNLLDTVRYVSTDYIYPTNLYVDPESNWNIKRNDENALFLATFAGTSYPASNRIDAKGKARQNNGYGVGLGAYLYDGGDGIDYVYTYGEGIVEDYYNHTTSFSGTPFTLLSTTPFSYNSDFGYNYPDANNDGFVDLDINNYSASYYADFIVPESGTYKFTIYHNNGIAFYVDGQLLINKLSQTGDATDTAKIALQAGRVGIQIKVVNAHKLYLYYSIGESAILNFVGLNSLKLPLNYKRIYSTLSLSDSVQATKTGLNSTITLSDSIFLPNRPFIKDTIGLQDEIQVNKVKNISINDSLDLSFTNDETIVDNVSIVWYSNVDLFIKTATIANQNLNLYISGPTPQFNHVDLFISGPHPSNTQLDHYLAGHTYTSDQVNLVESGHYAVIDTVYHYVNGITTSDSSLNLMIHGGNLISATDSVFNFIEGHSQGSEYSFGNVPLIIIGDPANSYLNLYLNASGSGHEDINDYLNLFINSDVSKSNGNIDLYIQGSNNGNTIFANGYTDLYISGDGSNDGFYINTSYMNLYIEKRMFEESNIDMYLKTSDQTVSNVDMFVNGVLGTVLDSVYMYMPTIGNIAQGINLFTRGYRS